MKRTTAAAAGGEAEAAEDEAEVVAVVEVVAEVVAAPKGAGGVRTTTATATIPTNVATCRPKRGTLRRMARDCTWQRTRHLKGQDHHLVRSRWPREASSAQLRSAQKTERRGAVDW